MFGWFTAMRSGNWIHRIYAPGGAGSMPQSGAALWICVEEAENSDLVHRVRGALESSPYEEWDFLPVNLAFGFLIRPDRCPSCKACKAITPNALQAGTAQRGPRLRQSHCGYRQRGAPARGNADGREEMTMNVSVARRQNPKATLNWIGIVIREISI
jgi:hypothetical protein